MVTKKKMTDKHKNLDQLTDWEKRVSSKLQKIESENRYLLEEIIPKVYQEGYQKGMEDMAERIRLTMRAGLTITNGELEND